MVVLRVLELVHVSFVAGLEMVDLVCFLLLLLQQVALTQGLRIV